MCVKRACGPKQDLIEAKKNEQRTLPVAFPLTSKRKNESVWVYLCTYFHHHRPAKAGSSLRTLEMQFPVFLLSKLTLLYLIKENKIPSFLCR